MDLSFFSNAAGMVKTVDDVRRLAATPVTHIVVGSITVDPRPGNPEPRFWAAPDDSFALNSLGLPNPGLDYYLAQIGEMCDIAHDAGKKLIVSIAGFNAEDWDELAACICDDVDGIEVNLGCPNVWQSGTRKPIISFDPQAVDEVVGLVRGVINPTWMSVKFSPFQPDQHDALISVASMLYRHSVDAIVTANTIPDAIPPVVDGRPVINPAMKTAGMSGPVLRPIVAENLRTLATLHPRTPLIAAGGIRSGEDMRAYARAGASGFQVGTHFFQYGEKVFSELLTEYLD